MVGSADQINAEALWILLQNGQYKSPARSDLYICAPCLMKQTMDVLVLISKTVRRKVTVKHMYLNINVDLNIPLSHVPTW